MKKTINAILCASLCVAFASSTAFADTMNINKDVTNQNIIQVLSASVNPDDTSSVEYYVGKLEEFREQLRTKNAREYIDSAIIIMKQTTSADYRGKQYGISILNAQLIDEYYFSIDDLESLKNYFVYDDAKDILEQAREDIYDVYNQGTDVDTIKKIHDDAIKAATKVANEMACDFLEEAKKELDHDEAKGIIDNYIDNIDTIMPSADYESYIEYVSDAIEEAKDMEILYRLIDEMEGLGDSYNHDEPKKIINDGIEALKNLGPGDEAAAEKIAVEYATKAQDLEDLLNARAEVAAEFEAIRDDLKTDDAKAKLDDVIDSVMNAKDMDELQDYWDNKDDIIAEIEDYDTLVNARKLITDALEDIKDTYESPEAKKIIDDAIDAINNSDDISGFKKIVDDAIANANKAEEAYKNSLIPSPSPDVTPSPEVTPTATPTTAPTTAPTATPTEDPTMVKGAGITVPTPVPTETPKLNVGDFVTRCYNVALGREADPEGYKYWVDNLNNGQACGAQVGFGFMFSDEYTNKNTSDDQFINDLYAMFFGRKADEAGFNYWKHMLESGSSRVEIFAGFANSAEFYALCSDYSVVSGWYLVGVDNEQQGGINCFVARLYRICLDRLPDLAGQKGWVELLYNKEISGTECAAGFILGQEFANKNLDNENFVAYMYRAFFGREADIEGFTFWLDALNSGAKTRTDVFYGFTGSPEYVELCAKYGIIA
ncbi:MAG: DUF4214 domain-containing protein [Clostridia bacterium]|nr:DUF4214 domain-containing protein [Clostridia bacterium]